MRVTSDGASLRILALVTDAYGAGGGIAQYNRDLIGAMAATDEVREIVVLTRFGRESAPSVPSKACLLPPRAGKVAYTLDTLRVARAYGPFDVIFCGHLFAAPLAAAVARATGAAYWQQLHGIEAWSRPGAVVRRAVEGAQLVTAVSRYTRRRFLSWARSAPETVRVLPNTVDERFTPGPKSNPLLRRHELDGKTVLLTVSRLASSERYKGHDTVIRAMAQLLPSRPDLVYVVAGDGDDRTRLEGIAEQQGVRENVRFVGQVPDHELPDLYRAADVFIMPSTGEGFGIVYLQALATGLPVIAGDADGGRDPLRDGKEGMLVGTSDPVRLAAAITKQLKGDREWRSRAAPFHRSRFDGAVTGLLGRLATQDGKAARGRTRHARVSSIGRSHG